MSSENRDTSVLKGAQLKHYTELLKLKFIEYLREAKSYTDEQIIDITSVIEGDLSPLLERLSVAEGSIEDIMQSLVELFENKLDKSEMIDLKVTANPQDSREGTLEVVYKQ